VFCASQVATYSRIPLLSQFFVFYLFIAAYVTKTVAPGDPYHPQIVRGLMFYAAYLVGFSLCNQLWQKYFIQVIYPPHDFNYFMLFVNWLPTVYFLALTYFYSLRQKK